MDEVNEDVTVVLEVAEVETAVTTDGLGFDVCWTSRVLVTTSPRLLDVYTGMVSLLLKGIGSRRAERVTSFDEDVAVVLFEDRKNSAASYAFFFY